MYVWIKYGKRSVYVSSMKIINNFDNIIYKKFAQYHLDIIRWLQIHLYDKM